MHAEAIQILRDVEERCDTSALLYRGVSYWPLWRLRLWTALMRRIVIKGGADQAIPNTPPSWPDRPAPAAEVTGPPALGLLRTSRDTAYGPCDALFFARPEEYRETTPRGAFAKFIDSVFERTAEHHAAAKVELADPRTAGFPRLHPALYLDLGAAAQGVRFDPPGTLEGLAEATAILATLLPDEAQDPAALLADMGKIFYFARIFEKLLRAMSAKALFLSVYYHPVGMAWMLACRRAGVRSVDIQHGRLGPIHGLYTHLGAAPPDGYHLMPDTVWCWGPETAQAINTTLNPACTRHRGQVGGNAWLAKWRNGDAAAFEPPDLPAFAERIQGRPTILVSLQPYDSPLKPELLEAMRAGPARWLWLLRLHPLRRHTAPHVAEIAARAGVTNIEMENATAFPLFSLLRLAHHHVTAFSSVVFEAAAFGLRSSLTEPEGRSVFAAQIENGLCRYTPTAGELIAHITEVLAGGQPPVRDNFMDVSREAADRTLAEILRH